MQGLGAILSYIVQRPFILALVFTSVGFAIYGASLGNQFLLDDESQVRHNAIIQSPANFPVFFLGSTMNQQSTTNLGGIYYKPLMSLSYSLLWWMSPDNPVPFHIYQLLLAIANAVLAFLFLSRHLQPAVAALMALLFLVHPLNTEVVVYIADLQDVLYTFFGLLALNYLAGQKRLDLPSATVLSGLLLLAMLSKESGILYVVICAVYAWTFARVNLRQVLAAIGVCLAVYLILRIGVAGLTALTYHQNQIGRASFGVRLLTAPLVLASYLWKFVFPRDITATQDWVITDPTWETFWLPLLCDLVILASTFIYAWRQWKISPRFAFFAFWVFMGMGFHSHIVVSLDGTVADRWFYFSSLGLVAMIGVLLWSCGLGFRSYLRGLDWYDNFTICEHDLKIFPDSYDMHNNLGVEHFRRGRIAEAKLEFERSVQLAPGWDVNWNNLGSVYFRTGDYKKAEESYLKAMENGPYYMAYENYASLLSAQGRNQEAIRFINEKALPLFPASQPLLDIARKLSIQ